MLKKTDKKTEKKTVLNESEKTTPHQSVGQIPHNSTQEETAHNCVNTSVQRKRRRQMERKVETWVYEKQMCKKWLIKLHTTDRGGRLPYMY